MKSLLRASTAFAAATVLALSFTAAAPVAQASEVLARKFHHECHDCGAPIYATLRCYGQDHCGKPIHRWVVSKHNCPAHQHHHHGHGHGHSHGKKPKHGHGGHGHGSYGHHDRGPSNKEIIIDAVSAILQRKLQGH